MGMYFFISLYFFRCFYLLTYLFIYLFIVSVHQVKLNENEKCCLGNYLKYNKCFNYLFIII